MAPPRRREDRRAGPPGRAPTPPVGGGWRIRRNGMASTRRIDPGTLWIMTAKSVALHVLGWLVGVVAAAALRRLATRREADVVTARELDATFGF